MQWEAVNCSKPQADGNNWFLARRVSEDLSFSDFEQRRDADGVLIRFQTEAQAINAI
jgi:hypothetical protein